MLYEFLISVIETNTKQQCTSIANTLVNYVVQEVDPNDSTNTLYWLGYQGTKIQNGTDNHGRPIYIQIQARVGYNQDDAANVINTLANFSPYCIERAYNPPLTQAQIDADLLAYATGSDGANAVWTIHPGDNISVTSAADLLSRFVATQ